MLLTNRVPLSMKFFDEIPIMYRTRMWYQHDGCPAHYATVARQVLDRKFPGR